jgi:hypothetical protein
MTDYCDPADLYDYGLPRGARPNPGRLTTGANTSTNAIGLNEHGLVLNDAITFRAEGSGAGAGSLPSPLVEGTEYYAIPLTASTFQVAAAADGAALDLTTAGSKVLMIIAPMPIEKAIAWASRIIDESLQGHLVPLDEEGIPEIVRMTCAELAAGKLLTGTSSVSITAMVDAAQKRLDKWDKGRPIRQATPPARAALAAVASAASSDPDGWKTYGGL